MDRNVGGWGKTEVAGFESFCLTLDTSIRDGIHLFLKLGIQLRQISEASQSQGEDSTTESGGFWWPRLDEVIWASVICVGN